jgi:hypothetical protein
VYAVVHLRNEAIKDKKSILNLALSHLSEIKPKEWGKLKWKVETPSSHTVFLDLNTRIQNNKIITNTYQKNMNLYLYIPPLSAHPPSCFKGLIAGEIRRYWLQNSPEDFKTIRQSLLESSTAQNVHTVVKLQDAPKLSSVMKTMFLVLKLLLLPESNLALQRRVYTSPI